MSSYDDYPPDGDNTDDRGASPGAEDGQNEGGDYDASTETDQYTQGRDGDNQDGQDSYAAEDSAPADEGANPDYEGQADQDEQYAEGNEDQSAQPVDDEEGRDNYAPAEEDAPPADEGADPDYDAQADPDSAQSDSNDFAVQTVSGADAYIAPY
jgi:hypothetical protein